MSGLSEYTALEINGESISLQDLLSLAKLNELSKFVDQAVDVILVRQAAAERNITISDEEFQQAADDFRLARDLHDVETTENWLAVNHFSHAEWEGVLGDDILRRKLRDLLVSDKVDQYFTEHRLSFDAAAVSRLVLKEEGVARELRAQIVDDGADFHSLARQYSIDAITRPAGGYAGIVSRSEMEAAVESAVFGVKPGKTIGPIKTMDGWELIRLESLHPATLDGEMRERIESILFNEWLSDRRLRARIRTPLLEPAVEDAEVDEEISTV